MDALDRFNRHTENCTRLFCATCRALYAEVAQAASARAIRSRRADGEIAAYEREVFAGALFGDRA